MSGFITGQCSWWSTRGFLKGLLSQCLQSILPLAKGKGRRCQLRQSAVNDPKGATHFVSQRSGQSEGIFNFLKRKSSQGGTFLFEGYHAGQLYRVEKILSHKFLSPPPFHRGERLTSLSQELEALCNVHPPTHPPTLTHLSEACSCYHEMYNLVVWTYIESIPFAPPLSLLMWNFHGVVSNTKLSEN